MRDPFDEEYRRLRVRELIGIVMMVAVTWGLIILLFCAFD